MTVRVKCREIAQSFSWPSVRVDKQEGFVRVADNEFSPDIQERA